MPYKDPQKQREAQHKYYLKNKDKVKQGVRHRRKRNKEYAWKIKADKGCLCGEDNPACLNFHHRDRTTKCDTVAQLICEAVSLKRLQNEIDKCDVMCANCHTEYHSSYKWRLCYKKKYVRNIKTNSKCKECGQKGIACLSFHHIDPKTKLEQITVLVKYKKYSLEIIKREIEKCELICENCHRKLHYKEKLS